MKDINILAKECYELNKELKNKVEKLKSLKDELKNLMLEQNKKNFLGDNFTATLSTYRKKYLSKLKPEFDNLSADKINDLISKNVIFLSYSLNTDEYERLIDKSSIEEFVNKRTSTNFVIFRDKKN